MSSHLVVYPARLLAVPSVRVISRGECYATVAIDGLVCSWCAARTQAALSGVPGVRSVEIDLEQGMAQVRYEASAEADEQALQSALDRVVLGKWARRFIEAIARPLGLTKSRSR